MKSICTLLLTALLACAAQAEPARTQAPAPRNAAIPSQPLIQALGAFADQTGLQLIYVSDLVEGRKSRGAPAGLSAQETLARLLEGTNLTFEFLNERTVAIRSPKSASGNKTSDAAGQQTEMLLAKTGVAEESTLAKGADQSDEKGDEVEEMLVEGEREKPAPFSTANLDLTRTESDALPFTVFTARDIELSGAASVQEFLQSRLPQNFNPTIAEETELSAIVSSSRFVAINSAEHINQVSMRGWEGDETVFLMNGRRMPAQYQSLLDERSGTTQLLGIPLGSIERIEILPSAGSAIYGASATGGVINIITRRDFKGGQLAVNYETPADVHAPRRGVDLNYSIPLPAGFGLRMAAGYREGEPLHAGDRAEVTIERWRSRVLEHDRARLIPPVGGNPFFTGANSALRTGATPNFRSTSTSLNLFAGIPGAPASNFSTVPAGYTGTGGRTLFQPGVFNLEVAEGANGGSLDARESPLGAINSDAVFTLGLDRNFGERWQWSLDSSYSRGESKSPSTSRIYFANTGVTSGRPRLPGSVANNPFGQDLLVWLVDPGLNRPELQRSVRNATLQLTSTLRGQFGAWRGFFDISYARNYNQSTTSEVEEPYGGWVSAFNSGAYNPLVDVRVRSPAAAPDFYENLIAKRVFATSATRNYQAAFKASGPLARMPGGSLQLTAGIDFGRVDRYQGNGHAQYQDILDGTPQTPIRSTSPDIVRDQNPVRRFAFDSFAGYGETNVPLVSSAQALPLLRQFELFASGRLEYSVRDGFRDDGRPVEYTDSSHVYAFGWRHEVLEGATLRASQSIGFRPPLMSDVTPGDPPTFDCGGCESPLNDPVRNEPVTIGVDMYIDGGNPDLKPETTHSTNFGLILTPRWAPGLRISVDYLRSVRNDVISQLGAQQMIDFEREFPDRVTRGQPDGNPGGAGEITFLNLSTINLREIASKSLDFSVEQRIEGVLGGRLVLAAAATNNLSFKVQLTTTGPSVEQIRNVSQGVFSAQQMAWNANSQLRWEGRQWSFGWSARYFDYLLVPWSADDSNLRLHGRDREPWKVDHDVNINYRTPAVANPRGMQWLLSGTSISFGVKNVFDREPRFWALAAERGVAPYDSIMGRSVWLQMRKDFD